jgi:hypothetical protein
MTLLLNKSPTQVTLQWQSPLEQLAKLWPFISQSSRAKVFPRNFNNHTWLISTPPIKAFTISQTFYFPRPLKFPTFVNSSEPRRWPSHLTWTFVKPSTQSKAIWNHKTCVNAKLCICLASYYTKFVNFMNETFAHDTKLLCWFKFNGEASCCRLYSEKFMFSSHWSNVVYTIIFVESFLDNAVSSDFLSLHN